MSITIELKFSDILKAIAEARKKKCDKVSIGANSEFTVEDDSMMVEVWITEIKAK